MYMYMYQALEEFVWLYKCSECELQAVIQVALLATLFISGIFVLILGILSAMKTLDKVCC